MNLLVTGGFGYIGGRFAEYLATASSHSVVLTTRQVGDRIAPANVRIVECDLQDSARLELMCRDIDVLVHLAGQNAAQCARAPDDAVTARVRTADAVIAAAFAAGVRRIVHVSSLHVYGAALTGKVDESTVPQPVHPYAISHFAAEERMRTANDGGEIETVILRLSNAFGAPAIEPCDCWTLATNELCRQAVQTRVMKLSSTGRQRRDFIAMSEVCRAILHACEVEIGLGLCNVGGNDAISLLQQAGRIADAVERTQGFRPALESGTREDAVGGGELHYVTARLRASGFEWRGRAAADELDRLATFCAHNVVSA